MLSSKKNSWKIHGSVLAVIIPLTLLCLVVTGYWYAYTGQGESAEAKPSKKIERVHKPEKAIKKYRSKEETTMEDEHYKTINAGTAHAYTVEKVRERGEREPDLSASTLKAEPTGDGKVQFTISLKNKGNIRATDVDILAEIDPRFNKPEKIKFNGCGKKEAYEENHGSIEFSNVLIDEKKPCTITFQTSSAEEGQMFGRLFVSPASEGGEELAPIEISVRNKGSKKEAAQIQTAHPAVEENSDIVIQEAETTGVETEIEADSVEPIEQEKNQENDEIEASSVEQNQINT